MAILRGGRRIGNFDIRLGLPRDRSLDNVAGDPRLKRAPGGGRESTINRFIANINQGEGLARPNRYLVVFNPPEKYKLGPVGTKQTEFGPPPYQRFEQYNQSDMKRNVGMMCNKVTMPSRDINTTAVQMYGPAREMPYSYSFPGNIECTFYGDKFLRQRVFFEEWQKLIYSLGTHDMNFYDDYVGSMDILQLGAFESNDDRDRVTYGVRLYEVYPSTLGSIEYTYGANDQGVSVPITFNFRSWYNLTSSELADATIGKSFGDVPTIKASKDFGLFGGILDKLPPELKRAGRDVLNQVKRSVPIGRATGGRVFPPFL
jgi:hypothetical protein